MDLEYKAVYITSRGGTHPIHRAYADSIRADYQYVDFCLRWHDVPSPAWKRYLSWVICAWIFPNREQYDLFITGGQQFPAIIMKKLGRVSSRKKIVCLHDNEVLYFLFTKRYSKPTSRALKWLLKQYDYHICTSQMQTDLLEKAIGKVQNVSTTFNGVANSRIKVFSKIVPDLQSGRILLIGNLYAGWRLWYKGVDLMIEAVLHAAKKLPIQFTIVGQIDTQAMNELKQRFGQEALDKVSFVGKVTNIEEYLSTSALYLHCARGEAFGISVLEAMTAGLPVIVSEWTGAKEVVVKACSELVVPLSTKAISSKIQWYFGLPMQRRKELSNACRRVSKPYTETNAIASFQKVVSNINL